MSIFKVVINWFFLEAHNRSLYFLVCLDLLDFSMANENEKKSYNCSNCKKCYKSELSLRRHADNVHKEKNFTVVWFVSAVLLQNVAWKGITNKCIKRSIPINAIFVMPNLPQNIVSTHIFEECMKKKSHSNVAHVISFVSKREI